jgi:hypothetical protein
VFFSKVPQQPWSSPNAKKPQAQLLTTKAVEESRSPSSDYETPQQSLTTLAAIAFAEMQPGRRRRNQTILQDYEKCV